MMIILSIPLILLCIYLAHLCYQKNYYLQAWAIGAFAFFLLLFSVGFIGASYYAWIEIKA
jgi:hypothetical protein